MRYPASRLPQVGTTIFTQMSQLASDHQAINLSQGFPDFEGPQVLLDRVGEYIKKGMNQYAPMTGVEPLRLAIADKIQRCYGRKVCPQADVTVTSGATEAIFAAIAATVRPGDEVIVFDPAYDSYEPAILLNGGVAKHIQLDSYDFSINWDAVREAITASTRMIILNSPHNPSGATLSVEDVAALEALVENTDILILADEVYEHILFDGRHHLSLHRYEALAERSFIVSSFGKTYHITGWKIGYCVAPAALSVEFRKVHQFLTFSTSTPMQYALADYLNLDKDHDQALGEFYQAKRDRFNMAMQDSRFQFTPSQGTYFQLMDYSNISDINDVEFVHWLVKEVGVAAIPLSVFYQKAPPELRWVRFCFAKRDETLDQALERLIKA